MRMRDVGGALLAAASDTLWTREARPNRGESRACIPHLARAAQAPRHILCQRHAVRLGLQLSQPRRSVGARQQLAPLLSCAAQRGGALGQRCLLEGRLDAIILHLVVCQQRLHLLPLLVAAIRARRHEHVGSRSDRGQSGGSGWPGRTGGRPTQAAAALPPPSAPPCLSSSSTSSSRSRVRARICDSLSCMRSDSFCTRALSAREQTPYCSTSARAAASSASSLE